eukprot:COSAG01_NODE_4479_length_4986_cov_2.568242_3_plen_58_part_00
MVDAFRIETIVGRFVFVYQLHVVADTINRSLYFISRSGAGWILELIFEFRFGRGWGL